MRLGYDFENNKIIVEEEQKPMVQAEVDFLNKIMAIFPNKDFSIEKNSNDYTTLKYKLYDLIRVKIGVNSQWISCFMADKELKKKYIDSPLFEMQKNKNQLHWKSKLSNINDYIEIIKTHIDFIDKQN